MSEIKNIQQFTQLFDEIKTTLEYYNSNLKNDSFEFKPNENAYETIKEGETIFDFYQKESEYLDEVVGYQQQICEIYRINKEEMRKKINNLIFEIKISKRLFHTMNIWCFKKSGKNE